MAASAVMNCAGSKYKLTHPGEGCNVYSHRIPQARAPQRGAMLERADSEITGLPDRGHVHTDAKGVVLDLTANMAPRWGARTWGIRWL